MIRGRKGAVAVFLMMILTAVLSVTAVLFEGASSGAAKSMSEGICDLAGRSALSAYHRELKEDYGIFAIYADEAEIGADLDYYIRGSLDRSSGKPLKAGSDVDVMDLVSLSLEKCSVDTTEFSLLLPDIIELQVLDYMKYRAAFSGLDLLKTEDDMKGHLTESTGAGEHSAGLEKEAIEAERKQQEEDRRAEEAEKEEESEGGSEAAEERRKREQEKKKLWERILGQKRRNEGWEPAPDAVSQRTLKNEQEKNALPSHQTDYKNIPNLSSMLAGDMGDIVMEGRNSVYLNEYITLHFSDYVREASSKQTFFRNEIEYILCGHDSDAANIRQIRAYLFALRTSLNLAHIYQDTVKRELTMNAALSIAPGPGAFAVQLLIATLWAGAESEHDINVLLQGEKVPFVKSKEDWALDLDYVLTGKGAPSADGNAKGQDYEDYLRFFLMLQNREARLVRMLDLIQLNLRLRCDSSFRAAEYCGGFSCQAIFTRRTGLFSPFSVSGGYTVEKIQRY